MNRTRPVGSRRPMAACCLALALAALTPAPGHADYKDTYLEGVRAAGAGDWGAVARAMEEAIAEEPRESERGGFQGMDDGSYVPHYYLGVARSQLGDCEGALRAWEVSTGQGVIQGLREYETLQQLRGGCEERLAETAVEDVEVVEEEPESRPAPPPAEAAPPRPEPAPVVAADETPRRPVGPPEPAAGEAGGQAERPKELREAPDPPQARERPPSPAATATPAGPPEALRAATRAYFDGDYPAVLAALSGQEFEDEAVAAQALLFRAAARYALYLLGGEEEETLAEEAREEVAFCRRLAPDLAPDPTVFSPRFVAFFKGE